MATKFFVIAENLMHARNSCEIDWGWERGRAKNTWVDPQGNTVKFIPDERGLDGLADARIYQGYRWYAAIRPHVLEERGKRARLEMVEPPMRERPAPAPETTPASEPAPPPVKPTMATRKSAPRAPARAR